MTPISFSEFEQLATQGNVIPLVESMLADLLTPVSAFLKLCGTESDGFLLESVEGGEAVARYSFLGTAPREWISFDGQQVRITTDARTETINTDIFTYLQHRSRQFRFVEQPDLPRFSGGMVGYFGYDTVRQIENLPDPHPPGDAPQAQFGLYDTVLAFDHFHQRMLIISNVFTDDFPDLRTAYDAALTRIAQIKTQLLNPTLLSSPDNHPATSDAQISSNLTPTDFHRAVERAKAHIYEGDIFQVVLSQRFSRPVNVPPFDLYRVLRMVNPSPYLYFLRNGDQAVVGASPELFVRVEDREVTVRPIAGTRPRGATPDADHQLAEELLADEKERAEHVMLIDLGRNDVGRVSEFGSVRLTENMIIERYSHVMHIVSEVRGTLRPELDAIDAFKACFPAGTLSGAPKVRALQIIDDLEPTRRGIYGGALGYLDFSGNLDTCIVIRTLELIDGIAHFQAGAGIVADSDPQREFEETVHKSNALRRAIQLAEKGLDQL